MGKTSDIWKYFSKSNSENSAKCLICDKNLACNKGSTKGLWDHFKSMHEKEYCQFMNQEEVIMNQIESDLTSKIEVELAQYKAEKRIDIDGDIFLWWRQNGCKFNTLTRIAQMLHCIPSTSVSSERLFSKAGIIYSNDLRNRLSGKMVQKILIIKGNLNEVELAPLIDNEEEDVEEIDSDDE
uniref:BED-type domain-containing protein n=1 Tax=Meloidogyne incognita TaxID=6306 RepID=A0A914NQ93_MELIC